METDHEERLPRWCGQTEFRIGLGITIRIDVDGQRFGILIWNRSKVRLER